MPTSALWEVYRNLKRADVGIGPYEKVRNSSINCNFSSILPPFGNMPIFVKIVCFS